MTRFHFGDSLPPKPVDLFNAETQAWKQRTSSSNHQREANSFGLYIQDTRVREWVADCWYAGYANAPDDGNVRRLNDRCYYQFIRSGSMGERSEETGSYVRFPERPNARDAANGFRIARPVE